jgi:hypothetical protein
MFAVHAQQLEPLAYSSRMPCRVRGRRGGRFGARAAHGTLAACMLIERCTATAAAATVSARRKTSTHLAAFLVPAQTALFSSFNTRSDCCGAFRASTRELRRCGLCSRSVCKRAASPRTRCVCWHCLRLSSTENVYAVPSIRLGQAVLACDQR